MIDLQSLLPENLFDEIKEKPKQKLKKVVDGERYGGNSLVGNFIMRLFVDENGQYYVQQSVQEPIGDYGWTWIDYWYACNNNDTLGKILCKVDNKNETN